MDAGPVADWLAALERTGAAPGGAGRAVAQRAAADLEGLLGPGWLRRAAQRPPAVRPDLAVLAGDRADGGGAAAFVEVIALWARLRLLVEHGVQGLGKVRGNLARNPSRDEFRHGVTQARLAAQALLAGARPVLEPPVGDLRVSDGDGEVLLELRGFNAAGPGVARRLVRAVELKARQTRASAGAWVWIADGGALWSLPAYADRSPAARVGLVAEGLSRVYLEYPHLLGVVLTSLVAPAAPPATATLARGAVFVRALPGGRVRDSVVVHRPELEPPRFGLVHRLCADEPLWLDAALDRLGLPSVGALLRA